MSAARDLLDALEARGARLGYRLVAQSPPGVIDDDVRRQLAAAKPRIVEALARADELGNPAIYKDLLNCGRDGFDWALGVQRELDADASVESGESFALIAVDGAPVGELSDLDREAISVDWSRPDPLTETAKLATAERARRAESAEQAATAKRTRARRGKTTGAPLLASLKGEGEPT